MPACNYSMSGATMDFSGHTSMGNKTRRLVYKLSHCLLEILQAALLF
jgi:hypothetical protein